MTTTQAKTIAIQVTCINLAYATGRHEGITHLGGDGWKWTRQQVINELESSAPRYSFYTSVGGKQAWVGVHDGQNGKYLQTHADGYWNNNLLALGQCS